MVEYKRFKYYGKKLTLCQNQFNFHAVPCGSHEIIPFQLTNQQSTNTEIVFDFDQPDFRVEKLGEKDSNGTFQIGPKSTVDLNLIFGPLSVTSFDFALPVVMNGIRGDLTPELGQGLPDKTWDKISPSRRVVATARRTVLFVEPVSVTGETKQRVKVTNVSADAVQVAIPEVRVSK